ncbi:MOP flippase family protein [Arenibacter troitsensis]|uniref:Polysaccharide transporter, PST family n=1 Tax=Arenibacter troitsensis TaxID=188872 RepID=A0A1X7JJ64_9FLAO|nr:MOP flippase family protein [Arenibacter troitsensis]SMG27334.1 polysaccharide transporter, PST family [Arenibacter troitsensis]
MALKDKVKKGVKWTLASTIVLGVSAIIKVSILTRFLDKSDFGLMALVTFVMGIMELFLDMGLTSAILHKQDITKKQYASLYWINWVACIIMYVVLFLITPFVASFYDQPLLNTLIPLIGLNLLFTGLGSQFKTIQQKHLLFNKISVIDITGAILSLALSIILAVNGFGVFALVYSLILQSLFSNVVYFIIGLKNQGLLFHFKLSDTRNFLKIGVYQVGGQTINYFNTNLDVLIIGKFFSADILGGYSLAKQLVLRPVQLINPIIVKVATPTLALFQNDRNQLKRNYLNLINVIGSINIPVYIGICIFAPWIVQILYGSEFDDIFILVRILSVYMIFRAINNPIGSLVVATGRTDLEFVWYIFVLLLNPLFIYFGTKFGIVGVTIGITLSSLCMYYPAWKFLIYKLTKASLSEYFKACFIVNWRIIYLIKK